MSRHDEDWETLTEAWQSAVAGPEAPAGFATELRRRRWITMAIVGGELGITVLLVWVTVQLVGAGTGRADGVFLGGLWLIWLAATGLAWWNRQGQWERDVVSTEAFVRLTVDRSVRKIRAVWISLGLLAAQLIFFTGFWISGRSVRLGESAASVWSVVLGVSAVYLGWAAWYYQRARREQHHFTDLLDELEKGP